LQELEDEKERIRMMEEELEFYKMKKFEVPKVGQQAFHVTSCWALSSRYFQTVFSLFLGLFYRCAKQPTNHNFTH
jgi:hypothetical protein